MKRNFSLNSCALAIAALIAVASPAQADWEPVRGFRGSVKFIPQIAHQCEFRLYSMKASRMFSPSESEIIRPNQAPYFPHPGPSFLGSLKFKVPLSYEGLRALFPQDEPNEIDSRGLTQDNMTDIVLHIEDYISNYVPEPSPYGQMLATAITYRRPGNPVLERLDHPGAVDLYRLHVQQNCPQPKALPMDVVDAPDYSTSYPKSRLSDGDMTAPWLGKANLAFYTILMEVPGTTLNEQEPWRHQPTVSRLASEIVINWYSDSVTYKPERISVRLSRPYGPERSYMDIPVGPGLKTVIHMGPELAEYTKLLIEFPGRPASSRYFYPGIREIEVKGYGEMEFPSPSF